MPEYSTAGVWAIPIPDCVYSINEEIGEVKQKARRNEK